MVTYSLTFTFISLSLFNSNVLIFTWQKVWKSEWMQPMFPVITDLKSSCSLLSHKTHQLDQGHGEGGGRQEAEACVVEGQHEQDVAERGLHIQVWGHQDGRREQITWMKTNIFDKFGGKT